MLTPQLPGRDPWEMALEPELRRPGQTLIQLLILALSCTYTSHCPCSPKQLILYFIPGFELSTLFSISVRNPAALASDISLGISSHCACYYQLNTEVPSTKGADKRFAQIIPSTTQVLLDQVWNKTAFSTMLCLFPTTRPSLLICSRD